MAKTGTSINILKKVVLDGLLFIFLILVLMAINHLTPMFHRGFFCLDESLMYPYKADTVPVWLLRLVGLGLPILAFFICEWVVLSRVRDSQKCLGVSIPAWIRGFYQVLVSFGFGVCFCEIATDSAKAIIGRPRPHFFDVCQPSTDCKLPEWSHRYIETGMYECLGSRKELYGDVFKSFLSGHSSWAAFTMIYLALYLNKRMTWSGCLGVRRTLQFVVVMLSWYCALSRVTDYKHHWSDVLAGYSLGVVLAVVTFKYGSDIFPLKTDSSLPQYESNNGPPVTQR